MVGIYKITNPKNAIYIGQSIDIIKRFNSYKVLDCKNQKKLYHSLKKYGFENHKFEIITECDIDQLNNLERYYQDLYNVLDNKFGLNCKLTASNDRSGKHSDDIKNKISIAHTGKKKPYMVERNKKYIGKKASDETKLKMSIAQTGRKASDETRKKLSEVQKGRKLSEEHKRKLSEGRKNFNGGRGVIPHNVKIVLDTETGFFYISSMEAWQHNKDYLKVGASCFRAKLLGKIKNNTKFIYA
jgi:group I intron endonuclease